MKSIWLSSKRMTIYIDVDDNNVIVNGSPIVRKFIGQSAYRLKDWMKKQGGLRVARLNL